MPCRALRLRLGWFGSATVFVLAAAIVLMLSLSAAPNLHERLHPAAGSLHECAVTLIAFGSCHHGAAAPLLIAPTTTVHLSKVTVLIDRGSNRHFLLRVCSSMRRQGTPDPLVLPPRAGGGVHAFLRVAESTCAERKSLGVFARHSESGVLR